MGQAQHDRLVLPLRNAERRLAAAEEARLNVPAGPQPRDLDEDTQRTAADILAVMGGVVVVVIAVGLVLGLVFFAFFAR